METEHEKKMNRFRRELAKMRNQETKKTDSDPDLLAVDRADLTDQDAEVFQKLMDGTLTVQELESVRNQSLSGQYEPEDAKLYESRRHFYAWLGNQMKKSPL